MSYRTARRVHVLLMSWLTLGFVLGWLPLVRSVMDGPSYQWGTTFFGLGFGGAGLSGDFWFAALMAALGVAFLCIGWRRPNGPFRIVLVAWLALMLADTLYSVVTAPESYRFQGDTLGIDISLAVAVPALKAVALGLALWWFQWAPALPVPPLGRANFTLMAMAAALLPVQFALLSRGQGQEAADVVGVLLTMTGWALFSAGLGLWRNPGPAPRPIQAI
ncbi:hypothetical protein RCO27_13790 [Sphingosinicella sp. LHD-64]|uniref:hypothetical protein n=1 Tax=Sphingosinicella sp. LHD-64 TaxID=3072139 RepID=UPI00280E2625|nr:hypothetical protein [Sphingosinicella sp. LHD-64]MDQ8757298.1 hypothetical protein [Sphingosinicella sp. LHD-64]